MRKNSKKTPAKIQESFQKIGQEENFDRRFWQQQGAAAIFEAAFEMVQDYLFLKEGHVQQPRLQKTVESFQRL